LGIQLKLAKDHEDEFDILTKTKQKDLSVEKWMERDWDLRAETDALFFILTKRGQSEKEFWKAGYYPRDEKILGVNTPTYDLIIQNKNPKQMKVLEIGSGIGRILIPMSEIFGEAIGADISGKMVEIAQKYIKDIPNCKIIQNNGKDLAMFSDDYFDFSYSIIVFQHIPDKKIIENYFHEVSRVLKTGSVFRFQVQLKKNRNHPHKPNTWVGYRFELDEINELASKHKFEILEKTDIGEQHWITFRSVK